MGRHEGERNRFCLGFPDMVLLSRWINEQRTLEMEVEVSKPREYKFGEKRIPYCPDPGQRFFMESKDICPWFPPAEAKSRTENL